MITRRKALAPGAALPAALILRPALAATPPTYSEGGVAIDGSDPVAYFREGRPVAGDPSLAFDWNGASWRFSTPGNRDEFAANPEAFAPQYGGYCAWAASQGYVADADPEAWDIHDGALYLNYNKSIRERWRQDKPGNIAKADAIWPGPLSN